MIEPKAKNQKYAGKLPDFAEKYMLTFVSLPLESFVA